MPGGVHCSYSTENVFFVVSLVNSRSQGLFSAAFIRFYKALKTFWKSFSNAALQVSKDWKSLNKFQEMSTKFGSFLNSSLSFYMTCLCLLYSSKAKLNLLLYILSLSNNNEKYSVKQPNDKRRIKYNLFLHFLIASYVPKGMPVPEGPYPRVNDTATIQKVTGR